MDNFQTWDTAWYHHEPMIMAWIIAVIGSAALTGFIVSKITEGRVNKEENRIASSVISALVVGIAFTAFAVNINTSQSNQRVAHYENAVSEVEDHYEVTLLEQRESPGDVPPQVDPQSLLEDLERGDYEYVTIVADNELLTTTAYVHHSPDGELLLMVEVGEGVVEYPAPETLGNDGNDDSEEEESVTPWRG